MLIELKSLAVALCMLGFVALIFAFGCQVGIRRATDPTRVGSPGWEARTWQSIYDRHMQQFHPEQSETIVIRHAYLYELQ